MPDRTREPAHPETDAPTWLSAFKPVLLRRSGAALGLWGDAGVGKTFTARAALRELSCRSLSVHATAPLSDIARVLPNPKRLPVWAERNLERLERGDHLEIADAANALAAVLNGLAPVVLHVEDLHETDAERAELWATLAGIVLRSRGVGLLVTSRVPPPEAFRAVHLEPLSRAQSDAVIAREAGSEVPPQALEWMYHWAAGNPLFTLEFFRFLARMGYLWSDAKRWHWRAPEGQSVPVTIEALIESVILRIKDAPELASILEAKAILPPGANETLWANVSALEPEALPGVRHRLEEQGLLVNGEFAHPLYREVIARNLKPQRRHELARRAFQALEREDLRAAAIFIKEARLESSEALAFLERATEAAQAAGDTTQEARYLVEAAEYATGAARGRLALAAAKRIAGVDLAQATRLGEIAASYEQHHTEAVLLLAQLSAKQLRGAEAEALLERLATSDRSPEQNFAWLIELRVSTHQYEGVLELVRKSPGLLERAEVKTVYNACLAFIGNGLTDEAIRICEITRNRAGLTEEDQALLQAVDARLAYLKADFEKMEALERQDLARGLRIGDLRLAGRSAFNLSLALRHLGRYRESLTTLEQTRGLFLELKDLTAYMIAQMMYGTTLHDVGQHELAEEHLLEAYDYLSRQDVSGYLHDCECSLSILYRDWRPPHGPILARKYAVAAVEHARHLKDKRMEAQGLQVLAMAEVMDGRASTALEAAQEAIRLATDLQLPVALYEAHVAHGYALVALGRDHEGLNALRAGQRGAEAAGDFTVSQMVGLEIDRLTQNTLGVQQRLGLLEKHGLVNAANLTHRHLQSPASAAASEGANDIQRSQTVRLGFLGPARVIVNNEPVSSRGAKRFELLAALLEARIRGRAEVSQLELCDALYPDAPELQAAQSLKKIVQLVRDNLGKGAILTTNAGYALGQVKSDAEAFLETLDTRLWRGAYLEGANLSRDDESVREALHSALRSKIEVILTTNPREAARVSRILLEAEPYDRACLALALRALRGSDNHRSLVRLYDDARSRFLEIGETLPERWQELLEPQVV